MDFIIWLIVGGIVGALPGGLRISTLVGVDPIHPVRRGQVR